MTPRPAAAGAALALAAVLAGCGERGGETGAAVAPAVSAPPPASATAAAVAPAASMPLRPSATATPLVVELYAAAGGAEAGVLQVDRIEIRRADAARTLVQRIDGVATAVPWTADFHGVEFPDLDFDGSADLRIVEAQGAGPNTTHRNWLYDAAASRWVAVPELDALPGVVVDARKRELRSEWRDGPARYGSDSYALRDGRLVPLRRERREYREPGRYTLTVERPAPGGGWAVVEKREGRDR